MKRWLTIIFISLAITIFIYPSAVIYIKDTLPDNNDTRLIAYIIGQVQDNILHLQPLFYGRFFAPDVNTLAYSDLFLTSALITLPFKLFISSPIVIFNLAFIINSTLTLCAAYLLFHYLFKNNWIASLTALLFTLSGFHLHYYPHLQMFSLWLFLLSIYFFLRFQKENRIIFLTCFFITLTAQIGESIFPAYLIFFTVFILFIPSLRVLYSNRRNPRHKDFQAVIKTIKTITLRSLPFIPFWLLLVFPYLKLHYSLPEATRPIRDAAHFSLGLEQIFTFYNAYTFIGVFLLALISSLRGTKRRSNLHPTSWKITLLFALVMSLGPVIKVLGQTVKILDLPIPLPYALFYYVFPGFSGFRTPSRFIILALLAATVLIGYAIAPYVNKIKTKTKIVIMTSILALLFFEADLPLKGFPVNINMHPVYQKVKNLPGEAIILELPIKLWTDIDHEIEPIRTLYTLEHRHRRLGGMSGFATNAWVDLVQQINTDGLTDENRTKLHEIGVTHVIENNSFSPLKL